MLIPEKVAKFNCTSPSYLTERLINRIRHLFPYTSDKHEASLVSVKALINSSHDLLGQVSRRSESECIALWNVLYHLDEEWIGIRQTR